MAIPFWSLTLPLWATVRPMPLQRTDEPARMRYRDSEAPTTR